MSNRAVDPKDLEVLKERLLKQAAEDFDRDMVEAQRLATKYPEHVQFGASYLCPKCHAALTTGIELPAEGQKHEAHVPLSTMADLVERYCSNPRSPYQKLRFKTRGSYDSLIKRIRNDCGDWKLADLKAPNIEELYAGWTAGGKLSMAHSLATMLRGLINFGSAILADAECERLSIVLHNTRFKMEKRRTERLTARQASEIRAMAHKMGRPSIALAQAIQFDCRLKQTEVIGEWVPLAEQGSSEIINNGRKWLRGLRWNQIDEDLILRHVTAYGDKKVELDLTKAPMVMQELMMLGERRTGAWPVIVCEYDGLPWTASEFRRWWRKVADACGIPKNVYNMDSRPFASATLAGEGRLRADAEIVRATEPRSL
jgi:hypothetical protein